MRVLFLDVDGVLNTHDCCPEAMCGQIHRDKMQLLNDVLRVTGASVVLSSAWRYILHRGECTLRGMEWLLRSHGMIAGRLLDVTAADTMMPREWNGEMQLWPVENERGQQISAWLEKNQVERYAVVDDLDLGIRGAGHPFVQTEGTVGLTTLGAAMLVEMLR